MTSITFRHVVLKPVFENAEIGKVGHNVKFDYEVLARYGVRVNALAPGYVQTELNHEFLASEAGERLRARIPQRRFGRAEELDGPLLLLASDAGAYITGSVVFADGGHLVSSL